MGAYVECRTSRLPPLTWTQFHALFLEKYVPSTLRYRNKNEFMALEKGSMSVDAYEDKFHALSRMLHNWLHGRGEDPVVH